MAQTHYTAFKVQTGQITGTLMNFPVLLKPPVGTTRFKTTANGGNVALATGYDLRPYTTSGLTGGVALVYQLVPGTYDAVNGTFEMWVQVPSAAVGSEIYLRYGDTGLTFDGSSPSTRDSGNKSAWPLPNGTTLTGGDLSSFNHALTAAGGVTAAVGQIDGGAAINGANGSYLTALHSTDYDVTTAFTFSIWAKTIDNGNIMGLINRDDTANLRAWQWRKNAANKLELVLFSTAGVTVHESAGTINDGAWKHLAAVYNGTDIRFYIDGALSGSPISFTGSIHTSVTEGAPAAVVVGAITSSTFSWNGSIDYPQIHNVGRSAAWIAAEYGNQFAPSTFYAIAAEDTAPSGLPAPFIATMTPSSAQASVSSAVLLTGVGFTGSGLDGTGGVFTSPGFTFSNLTIASGGASGSVDIRMSIGMAAGVYPLTFTTTGGTSSGATAFNFTVTAAGYFGYVNADAESFTLMAAGGLGNLAAQGWTYWNTVDVPEGAWNTGYSHAPIDAVLTLPGTLGTGTYYIFAYFMDLGTHRTITCQVGSAISNMITTGYATTTGFWNTKMTLVTTAPATTMTVHFAGNITTDESRIFRGIYITSNPNVTILADGTAVNLTVPTVMDDSAAVKGNLIANSSFELGIDANWYQNPDYSTLITTSEAHSGSQCVRVSTATTSTPLVSRIYHLKANKFYTLSAWIKCASSTFPVNIRMVNTFVPPDRVPPYPPQYVLVAGAYVTTTWQRISVAGYAVAYPTADFQLKIHLSGDTAYPGNFLYIDDVQLEEGSLTTYVPGCAIESLIVVDSATRPGNIYYSTDALTATLKTRNTTSAPRTDTLRTEIVDYLNRTVSSNSISVSLTAGQQTSTSFSLATGGLLGAFRLRYWLDNEPISEKELNYSIIPPVTAGVDLSSYMGIHCTYTDYELRAYGRLGMKWNDDLSPAATNRWAYGEPTDNGYTYADADVATAAAHNITILSNMGEQAPAWALTGTDGTPNVAKWAEYVTNRVNHYKTSNRIKYWEIENEPLAKAYIQGTNPANSAAVYAELLYAAANAIEIEDPSALIVGMGGMAYQSQIDSVLAALAAAHPTWDWKTHLDALSVHIYPGALATIFKDFITTNGVPFWNTETGYWTLGPFTGPYANWAAWGKQVLPFYDASRWYREFIDSSARVVENFVGSIAGKMTKYFYYDGRLAASPEYFIHHPTIMEYDGSIRTKGVAYAIAGAFIDHATGRGNVSPDANSQFWPFTTSAAPVALLYASDSKPRQVVLSGVTHTQLNVLDLMGNAMTFTGTTIPYGRQPIYVKGVGITADQLSTALQTGTVSLVVDTTAPSLQIVDGPRGTIPGAPFRMRWLGLDAVSFPNYGEYNIENNTPGDAPAPAAIEYAYRLLPDTTWSTWSAVTYRDYAALAAGSYTFEVKSRDAALNESAVVTRALTVGATVSTTPPTITTLTPTSAIPNPVVPIVLQGVQIAGADLNGAYAGGPSLITFSNSNVTISGTPVRTPTLITMNVGITAGAGPNAGTVSVQTDGGIAATGFIVSPTPSGS